MQRKHHLTTDTNETDQLGCYFIVPTELEPICEEGVQCDIYQAIRSQQNHLQ